MTMGRTLSRIRFNGRPARVVCGQMIDFLELELPPAKLKQRPKCTCGAHALGYQPYMAGHSDYCDVHEDKTPIGVDNPHYAQLVPD